MNDIDYYQILGVSRNASLEEIKSSYRSLAKETHPDLNQGDSESTDKFKLISEAYEVLSDPQRRADYDNPNPFQHAGFGEFSFNPFGSGSGGFFSQFSFSAERPPPAPIPPHGTQRGMNYEVELTVTPFSLLLEHEVTLEYNRMVRCPECNGHGADRKHCPTCEGHGIKREVRIGGHQRQIRDTDCHDCGRTGVVKENICNFCNGTGLAGLSTTMSLKLRPDFESVIVLQDGGHFGPYGGPAGDLLIRLKIVFPSSDKITEEVRNKLQESYELIYNSSKED